MSDSPDTPISASLNEVESLARRAARGAGLSWGLAEEAGRATRVLSAQGFGAPQMLACLLSDNDRRDYAQMAPHINHDHWHAAQGALCPVCTGAALSDRLHSIRAGQTLRLRAVHSPMFLAAFLCPATELPGDDTIGYTLSWPGVRISVSCGRIHLNGKRGELDSRPHDVALVRCRDLPSPAASTALVGTVDIEAQVWRCLNALASRTYVPASEASRLRGAG